MLVKENILECIPQSKGGLFFCVFRKRVDISQGKHLCLIFTKSPESWRCLECGRSPREIPRAWHQQEVLGWKTVTTEACKPQVTAKVRLPTADRVGTGWGPGRTRGVGAGAAWLRVSGSGGSLAVPALPMDSGIKPCCGSAPRTCTPGTIWNLVFSPLT